MIVSNFELLTKRIATLPAGTPPNILAPFRRVVQGYFLLVTNLDVSRTARFRLRLTITTSTGNREINNQNTNSFFDNGSVNNSILTITKNTTLSDANKSVYTTSNFQLGPRQTGLVVVLPFINNFLFDPNPDIEIRGFVELEQVRINIFQGAPAVEVLVNPETRGTFLDNAYPVQTPQDELDFDQIAYSLPISTGKTQNTIAAVPPIIIGPIEPSFKLKDLELMLIKNNKNLIDLEIKELAEMIEAMQDSKELQKFLQLPKK